MIIKIELSEIEIQDAIKAALEKKLDGIQLDWSERNKIKLDGSVRFKKKAVRKQITRFKASLEIFR